MKTVLANQEKSVCEKPSAVPVAPAEVVENREKWRLLDVRTPAEFEELHIDGAALHTFGEIHRERLEELAASGRPCVLVCLTGKRAGEAARKLGASLPGLRILEGGLQAWTEQGLPVVRGKKSMSLERQVRIAAGFLVLSGSLLALLVHPAWCLLSGFVGAGLIFAGLTDTCGMGMLLARMPWNHRPGGEKPSCCLPE